MRSDPLGSLPSLRFCSRPDPHQVLQPNANPRGHRDTTSIADRIQRRHSADTLLHGRTLERRAADSSSRADGIAGRIPRGPSTAREGLAPDHVLSCVQEDGSGTVALGVEDLVQRRADP
jgi:hypothetical protein